MNGDRGGDSSRAAGGRLLVSFPLTLSVRRATSFLLKSGDARGSVPSPERRSFLSGDPGHPAATHSCSRRDGHVAHALEQGERSFEGEHVLLLVVIGKVGRLSHEQLVDEAAQSPVVDLEGVALRLLALPPLHQRGDHLRCHILGGANQLTERGQGVALVFDELSREPEVAKLDVASSVWLTIGAKHVLGLDVPVSNAHAMQVHHRLAHLPRDVLRICL
eukprot:scaffold104742_cov63-Phaeocystis_antarctica.AAC.1